MATLREDIAALADEEEVMWALSVLTEKGINGVMFEKLIGLEKLRAGCGLSAQPTTQEPMSEVWGVTRIPESSTGRAEGIVVIALFEDAEAAQMFRDSYAVNRRRITYTYGVTKFQVWNAPPNPQLIGLTKGPLSESRHHQNG